MKDGMGGKSPWMDCTGEGGMSEDAWMGRGFVRNGRWEEETVEMRGEEGVLEGENGRR